ncbi:MAG TPA: sialate O-acetylesterase [Prosthecobacter sp.]|nr:sialate O-acetylesterase [Prosthecobacter sp.]
MTLRFFSSPAFVLPLFCAVHLHAEVTLPAVISDHMVLQSSVPTAIWGWAEAGEEVTVNIVDRTATTIATKDGRWRLKLGALPPSSQPQTLTVKGKNTLTIQDVLIGEVWLGSGQSNMEMRLKDEEHGSVLNADAEIAAAQFPEIRMFVHDATFSIYDLAVPPVEPLANRPGHWQVCSPETAAHFSAVGYFFARDLHQQTGVPVGIISAAVGGTPIEAWTSLPAQKSEPVFKPLLADWRKRLEGFEPGREQQLSQEKKKAWLKQRAEALKKGETVPKAPPPFKNLGVMTPGGLFNGLIAPVAPYTIRGCIWYQGERNAAGPFTGLYGAQLQTLIQDWRARWGDDFHFAWVQLPRFGKPQTQPSEPKAWGVSVREGMRRALAVPNTGMAITIDLGGEKDGHPTNKSDYATRLSKVVLHEVYKKEIPIWSGPLLDKVAGAGGKMTVTFKHGDGLRAASGELQGFAIAGADQKFVWAKTRIQGDQVIVWHDTVAEPVAVRYGWAANPICNLVNGANLPASPFRTDDWPQ